MPFASIDEDSARPFFGRDVQRPGFRRTLKQHIALLLLTLAVVIVPNAIAFASSVLASE